MSYNILMAFTKRSDNEGKVKVIPVRTGEK